MSIYKSKTVSEFKKNFAEDLKKAASGLTNNEELQVCINLFIAPATLARYTGGNPVDVRRLELAEKILAEIKKIKTA
jgi:hypothetical protein